MLHIRRPISRLSHVRQWQIAILGPLEWRNHFGPSNKVVYLKKNWIPSVAFWENPSKVKWYPLKQTKTKNGHHFRRLTFKVIQLCCLTQKDSFTPKVLKLHFVSVKHGSASIWYVAHSMFDIEAESYLTVTNCDFRTFRVKESFWAKQQSCITLKVSFQKWCPFFVFVCFNGCHFT